MKKGKKGMRQNHSRSAEATKQAIKKLTLETDMSARQICDKLELGYSTVMKYRKQILREQEAIAKKKQEVEELTLEKNLVSFKIKEESFEVEVRTRKGNKLYSLLDLKNGIEKFYSMDLDSYVSKTIDNGGEYIYGSYLIPIANKLLDYAFTSSVKSALFNSTNNEGYNKVLEIFNSLAEFTTKDNTEEKEEVLKTQTKLLETLDEASDIQELTSITSKLKKTRMKIKELEQEEKIKEYLSSTFETQGVNLGKIVEEIKKISL